MENCNQSSSNHYRTFGNIGTASGFVGCMRRVKIGRRSVHFRVPPEGRKVSRRGRHYEERRGGNLIDNFLSGRTVGSSTKTSTRSPTVSITTVIKMNGITQCGENPCWKTPCANDATCVWKTGLNFTCNCKPGFTGKQHAIQGIKTIEFQFECIKHNCIYSLLSPMKMVYVHHN